jgi:hypothetical protein
LDSARLVEEDSMDLPPRRGPRASFAVAGLLVLTLSRPVLANPSARLVYSRGAEALTCPTEEAVRSAVATRLGYDPFFPWAPTTVVVDVEGANQRFRADVRLIDEHGLVRGARHLETKGSECAELMAAMALTISLVVDPLSLTSPAAPSEPEDPSREPVAPTPPSATPSSALPSEFASAGAPLASRPAPPPEKIHTYFGAGVLGSLGTAPDFSFGGDAFFGARLRAFSLELDARGEVPVSASTPAGTVRSERLMGSLVPCVHVGVGVFCGVGSLAWVHAAGSADRAEDGSAFAAALGLRAGIELKLASIVWVRPYVDLLGELLRPNLQSATGQYRFPPVSGNLGAALLVRLF